MRTIEQSRTEFNTSMDPYCAVIIQTEYKPFTNDFFNENDLAIPASRIEYTPPAWVGAEYMPLFSASYGRKAIYEKTRDEKIPRLPLLRNYLICDDYVSDGETLEIAMLRFVERGIKMKNIWCISYRGTAKQSEIVLLDNGLAWHNYRIERRGLARTTLEAIGFKMPKLEIPNRQS